MLKTWELTPAVFCMGIFCENSGRNFFFSTRIGVLGMEPNDLARQEK